MHCKINKVDSLGKAFPLEEDELLEVLHSKDLQLVRVDTLVHEAHLLVGNDFVAICISSHVLIKHRNHVNLIPNFVHLFIVFFFCFWSISIRLCDCIKFGFMEYLPVAISQVEQRPIVRSSVGFWFSMSRWPFVKVEVMAEDLTVQ